MLRQHGNSDADEPVRTNGSIHGPPRCHVSHQEGVLKWTCCTYPPLRRFPDRHPHPGIDCYRLGTSARKDRVVPALINEMDPLRDSSEACRRELQTAHRRWACCRKGLFKTRAKWIPSNCTSSLPNEPER
jgi:hypothetical protein